MIITYHTLTFTPKMKKPADKALLSITISRKVGIINFKILMIKTSELLKQKV